MTRILAYCHRAANKVVMPMASMHEMESACVLVTRGCLQYLQLPLQEHACLLRPLCDSWLQACKLRHLQDDAHTTM